MAKSTEEVYSDLIETRDRLLGELRTGNIKPSYSINGQSVQWTEYRKHLIAELKELAELIALYGEDDGGIAHETTQYTT